MSRRTVESNKAIRLAWEKERDLVQEGKGTRDWTKDQQRDILNPDKGKAYDAKGRAFEGQHMKSVEKYPEYQGDSDNIQFLTKEEHLEAHQGSWQNPTNWYYDPVTKEITDFGDGKYIPCEVLELSDPVIIIKIAETESKPVDKETKEISDKPLREESIPSKDSVQKKSEKENAILKSSVADKPLKGGFVNILRTASRIIVEHPVESIEIVAALVTGIAKITSLVKGSSSAKKDAHKSGTSTRSDTLVNSDIVPIYADAIEIIRTAPRKHTVKEHSQRYGKDKHWMKKKSYTRGGDKE